MDGNDIQIRQAVLSNTQDADDYKRSLQAYATDDMGQGQPLNTDLLQRVVDDLGAHPTARIWLADHRGQPAGFATTFFAYSTFRAAPLVNVHDLAVEKAYRGKGVARALMLQIARNAREEGCCKVTLEVRKDNTAAEALYRSMGFRESSLPDGSPVPFSFLELSVN